MADGWQREANIEAGIYMATVAVRRPIYEAIPRHLLRL
jgi:hypothetical protein